MKKYLLVSFAAMLGIAFSAFTTIEKRPNTLYEYDKNGTMTPVPSNIHPETLCPSGNQFDCKIEIDGQDELIYVGGNVVRWQ